MASKNASAVPRVAHGGGCPCDQRRERRFGLRAPLDDHAPAPFKVLINVRWLAAGIVLALSALLAVARRPQRWPTVLKSVLGLGSATLVAAVAEARQLRFEVIELPLADLPAELDGLKVAQLSDFHLGRLFTVRNLRRTRAWLDQVCPDIIALTGDFVTEPKDIALLRVGLAGLSAPHGLFAVLGNHDYWTDVPAIECILQEHGVELLRNEQRLITINGAAMSIVGVDCVWEQLHDVAVAMRERPAGVPALVLAHEPDVADEIAPYGVALQLSGHTHAGHFALPWFGPAFLPRHGFRHYRGLQRIGSMWLYVSRGLGGFPLRLGCPPEATLFTLRQG